jgi:hypothetical protein
MERMPATRAQRIGMTVAFVEACLFALVSALHFGVVLRIAAVTLEAQFLYPAGIVEGFLALALFAAILLPGEGAVRAGRVLAAQILVVIGIFVAQIALVRGSLLGIREEVFYAIALLLALASITLIASPVTRRHARQ